MKKWSIAILLLLGIIQTGWTQEKKEYTPPRLLVGIKIDGLKTAHLHLLWKNFSVGGFRKLMTQGMIIEELNHPILDTGTAADDATISTGSIPFYHGVVGNHYFDKKRGEVTAILQDKKQKGIGTKHAFSAKKLLTTNIADEIKLKHPHSYVYSIGIDPHSAIMYGGHNADAVSWIDAKNSRWATSSYYNKGLYKWADDMNANGECQKIMSKKWTPVASITSYRYPTQQGSRTQPFAYTHSNSLKNDKWLCIPNANEMVYQLAQRTIDSEPLGRDKQTDALFLQFTVNTPFQQTYKLTLAEQEDMYIRLDGLLQQLFYKIEQKVGKAEVLFFVVGSGGDTHAPDELKKQQIPAGYFNAENTLALLNSYLVAIYGQEKWIKGYYAKNIFINKKKVAERKINLTEMKEKITQFLLEFESIQAVYTATDIRNLAGQTDDDRAYIRNSYHPTKSGDCIFTLRPGWIENTTNGATISQSSNPRTTIPFIVLKEGIAPHVKTQKTFETIDIAPTICSLLRLSRPNAAIGKTIKLEKE